MGEEQEGPSRTAYFNAYLEKLRNLNAANALYEELLDLPSGFLGRFDVPEESKTPAP